MLGSELMAAPVTAPAVSRNSSTRHCKPSVHHGCVDAHWANRGLFATDLGNSPSETLQSCASKCGSLGNLAPFRGWFTVFGVGWGGAGHGSNCLCGNAVPPQSKILTNDKECTAHACSGNNTQNCGGNWRTWNSFVVCAPLNDIDCLL